MLASTMQISTNNQPTTHNHPPQPRKHPPRTVWAARPHLAPKDNHRLFFQDPTGCPPRRPAAPPTPFPTTPHHKERGIAVLEEVAVAGPALASVSAIEHPTTTLGQRGLLGRFPDLGAP